MSKTIYVRNVPDDLHRKVEARARRARLSLSAYVLHELEQALAIPPLEVVLARIAKRDRLVPTESPAQMIRAERGAIDR